MRIRLCSTPGCTRLVNTSRPPGSTRCIYHATHGEQPELLALIESGRIPSVA